MVTLEHLRELAAKYEAEVGQAVHHFIDYIKTELEHLFVKEVKQVVENIVDPTPNADSAIATDPTPVSTDKPAE
jgi:hypothetical protein